MNNPMLSPKSSERPGVLEARLSRYNELVENARQVARQLTELERRLIGPTPADEAADDERATPVTYCDHMCAAEAMLHTALRSAEFSVQRIHEELGTIGSQPTTSRRAPAPGPSS